jgi:DNA-binding transcriptional regulator YdaS (Cro superfamily)
MFTMKLADYLAKHSISQIALAHHLGVSQGRVWQWLNGEKVTPKYCPEIEKWSNREVTCEELNDSVNWKYVRESAQSIADSDVIERAKASDDAQPPVGGTTGDEKLAKMVV